MLERGEGSPEAKFGLCSHTWHLQALDLVLLGSELAQVHPPAGLDTGWPIPQALSQARAFTFLVGWGAILWPNLKTNLTRAQSRLWGDKPLSLLRIRTPPSYGQGRVKLEVP